jgi:L-malate glycosyltransferase
MKVLHISTAKTWRGGEQQIAYLIGELAAKGIEQFVVCSADSAMRQYCSEKNVPHKAIRKTGGTDFIFAYRLSKIIKAVAPDMVHLHDAHAHTAAVIAATFFGIKTPFVLHRRVVFDTGKNFFSRYKFSHSQIKKVICISEAVKAKLLSFVSEEKLTVIHSAIDGSRFSSERKNILREAYRIPAATKIIGNIAALTAEKDYITFVNTVAVLKQNNTDAKYFIIGEGKERNNIEAHISKLGLQQDIIMLGFRKDIEKILPEFDVLLFTSQSEGFGTTILDAFCCRVPVVATNMGGIRELVEHEKTGMLSVAHAHNSLAENVLKILNNTELKNLLIESAFHKAQHFSKSAMAEKVMGVYKEVL